MTLPDRITLVLRVPSGATLGQVLPFIQPGVPVGFGHGLAVIAARSDRDALEDLRMVESQLVLAEAAIKRSVRPGSGLRTDDWIATVQNARRYEWLRDRGCIEDVDADLLVLRGDTYFTGDELDHEIDAAMRVEQMQAQQDTQEQQP